MKADEIEVDVFELMDALNSDVTANDIPGIETIAQRASDRQRRKLLAIGAIGCVLILVAVLGAWATLSGSPTTTETAEETIDSRQAVSQDELVEWIREHASTPRSRFVFDVMVTSDESTEPMLDLNVELSVHTDTLEITEIGVYVTNDPCQTDPFVWGLLRVQPDGVFVLAPNEQPLIGRPLFGGYAMPEQTCEAPRPREFQGALSRGVTVLAGTNEITFTSIETGRNFRFTTTSQESDTAQ